MPFCLDVIGQQVGITGQSLVYDMHHSVNLDMVARHDTCRIVDHPQSTVGCDGRVQITPQHVLRVDGSGRKTGRFIVSHFVGFSVYQVIKHHFLDRLHGIQKMLERPVTLFFRIRLHRRVVRHKTGV